MGKFNYLLNAFQGEQAKQRTDSKLRTTTMEKRHDCWKRLRDSTTPVQRTFSNEMATTVIQLRNEGKNVDHRWLMNMIFRKFESAIQTKVLEKGTDYNLRKRVGEILRAVDNI
ncbi:hypothetical protein ANCCEY_13921 [Ancylostoma ceylanicum]|uniref:Uncharacterized protein n=1 Tax=Ancylostoma ceylanicum TaxID=53326 RepID=A0A0D6L7Q0_9BILA|nr:hypothetical protein ANCCEY_13921 [Ancylostoma ceylanicum]